MLCFPGFGTWQHCKKSKGKQYFYPIDPIHTHLTVYSKSPAGFSANSNSCVGFRSFTFSKSISSRLMNLQTQGDQQEELGGATEIKADSRALDGDEP